MRVSNSDSITAMDFVNWESNQKMQESGNVRFGQSLKPYVLGKQPNRIIGKEIAWSFTSVMDASQDRLGN